MNYMCFDIGGTAVKYAVADENGRLFDRGQVQSRAKQKGGIVEQVAELVNQRRKEIELEGVAIATAGLVDDNDTVVFVGEHFVDYAGTNWQKTLAERCDIKAHAVNDANAAALGEYWLGAGRLSRSLYMLTVGTGVGGGFVLNGQIVTGAGYSAGEIGFIPVGDGVKLEDMAAGSVAAKKIADEKNLRENELSGEKIFAMAKNGDATTLAALKGMCLSLAQGIAVVCCAVNPEVIVLGGGAVANEDILRPLLEGELERLLPAPLRSSTRIEFAALKNNAGLVGALKYFLQKEVLL